MMDPSSSSAAVPAAAPAVGDGGGGGGGGPAVAVSSAVAMASRRFQHLLDRSTPHVGRRWLAFAGVAAAYALRVWFAGGYYIVTYALGIYILNLLIAFLSPQVDPEVAEIDIFVRVWFVGGSWFLITYHIYPIRAIGVSVIVQHLSPFVVSSMAQLQQ
uniref:Putative Rer1 (Endoplasmic reticulum retrieval) family protein n=1 Tax=Oryza sativa subsp. japonica TaxID=39947 RepID=Q6UUG3_ORYSJ|nr:putative Rer1 (endoplasmic reticulum retrieval) family protein [Oryza sativa Japonica Group]